MERRFANLFGMREEEAIALLDTPLEKLKEDDSRYVAAAQLGNFPSERSIAALIRAIRNSSACLDNRIVRRKAIESLGRLKASIALPIICTTLIEDDCYTVENAVWAIGEIGTENPAIHEEIAQLLTKPNQTYRVIIHTLAKFKYTGALERIKSFTNAEDSTIASAAITAVCRLTGDYTLMEEVVDFLFHPQVYTRRLCIQDLIDAHYYQAIPTITQCPVSMVFRLRGVRSLAALGIAEGKLTWEEVKSSLTTVIADNPRSLQLVHRYDVTPSLTRLIEELYETDFGRCYLATQTLLETNPHELGEALLNTYQEKAHNDYGAHYHVIKLLGWLKYSAGYNIVIEALHNTEPQFMKSRTAAAIALGEYGNPEAITHLKQCLEGRIWELKYAATLALTKLGVDSNLDILRESL